MSTTTRRTLLSAFIGLCAASVAACHGESVVRPLPPGDGSLTGTWIQPGIDTWTQLDLSQSGARVVGYHRFGSVYFGLRDSILITGTAALPQVTLQWTQYFVIARGTETVRTTVNATLSANGDSLTGTYSVWDSANPPTATFPLEPFRRSTP
jgi:hypothetical protein